MSDRIKLNPVEMTVETMKMLEDRGLIIRLCPDRHRLNIERGKIEGLRIYTGDARYGSHMLLAITIDRQEFSAFGTHPDNEEFMLIGGINEKIMYLAVALYRKDELQKKIDRGTISEEDFVCLKCRYNDPEVSFFTMLKDVPHGEAVEAGDGRPATFYVTEPSLMGLEPTDFKGRILTVT